MPWRKLQGVDPREGFFEGGFQIISAKKRDSEGVKHPKNDMSLERVSSSTV
jgi:hypothetical protein